MPIHLDPAVPILRIFDEKLARDFYVGWLGFTWDWEHRFDADAPIYAQVSRDAAKLHLSEHVGDGTPGTIVYLSVTGIQDFHAELRSRPWKLSADTTSNTAKSRSPAATTPSAKNPGSTSTATRSFPIYGSI